MTAPPTPMILGFHAVLARLRSAPDSVIEVLVAGRRDDRRARDLLARLESSGVKWRAATDGEIDRLAGDARHQGVVARVRPLTLARDTDEVIDRARAAGREPLLLVLDEVQDPHNVGACLRSADAFGADAVVIPRDRAAGAGSTVAKVASGAAETVPLIAVGNLARALDELKDRDVWILGADAEGAESLAQADLGGAIAWVLGAEGRGLRRLTRERCDRLVRIPIGGSVQSLNVSVAAGICLYASRVWRDARRSPG